MTDAVSLDDIIIKDDKIVNDNDHDNDDDEDNEDGEGGGANAAKTPVSLLQELYVRRGLTPKYDLVQIEGAVHEPTFKYRYKVCNVGCSHYDFSFLRSG